jgi:hypothetical protein
VSNKGEEHADVQQVVGEIRNESGQILSQDEEPAPVGGEAEEEEEGDDEEDEEDEDLIVSDDIKEVLCDCLDNAKSAGTFAHYDTLKDAPNPGLFIKGFGAISLPLPEIDIQMIIAASRRSPGNNTMLHAGSAPPSPKKPWLVSGSSIETQNPSQVDLGTGFY